MASSLRIVRGMLRP